MEGFWQEKTTRKKERIIEESCKKLIKKNEKSKCVCFQREFNKNVEIIHGQKRANDRIAREEIRGAVKKLRSLLNKDIELEKENEVSEEKEKEIIEKNSAKQKIQEEENYKAQTIPFENYEEYENNFLFIEHKINLDSINSKKNELEINLFDLKNMQKINDEEEEIEKIKESNED